MVRARPFGDKRAVPRVPREAVSRTLSPVKRVLMVPSDPADPAAFKAARTMCRRWADFAFAARFLDRSRRDAGSAVVAFFGMIAEAIGKEAAELEGARGLRHHPAVVSPAASRCSGGGGEAIVEALRQRLNQIYAGGLELPSPASRSPQQHAMHALARTVQRFDVGPEHFLRFAEERVRDATVTRYPTWSRLEQHCRATGGSIARALGEVLGLQHSDGSRMIERLGVALRLVQVLRDVNADRERDRICLPLEDLARCRYSERDLLAGVVNERLEDLRAFEAERARELINEGCAALPWIAGDKSRLFVATLVALAEATLRRPPSRPQLTTAMRLRQLPAAWKLVRERGRP